MTSNSVREKHGAAREPASSQHDVNGVIHAQRAVKTRPYTTTGLTHFLRLLYGLGSHSIGGSACRLASSRCMCCALLSVMSRRNHFTTWKTACANLDSETHDHQKQGSSKSAQCLRQGQTRARRGCAGAANSCTHVTRSDWRSVRMHQRSSIPWSKCCFNFICIRKLGGSAGGMPVVTRKHRGRLTLNASTTRLVLKLQLKRIRMQQLQFKRIEHAYVGQLLEIAQKQLAQARARNAKDG